MSEPQMNMDRDQDRDNERSAMQAIAGMLLGLAVVFVAVILVAHG